MDIDLGEKEQMHLSFSILNMEQTKYFQTCDHIRKTSNINQCDKNSGNRVSQKYLCNSFVELFKTELNLYGWTCVIFSSIAEFITVQGVLRNACLDFKLFTPGIG